jgi:hypothetical protein
VSGVPTYPPVLAPPRLIDMSDSMSSLSLRIRELLFLRGEAPLAWSTGV